ncbi:PepSY-associated TM helix domain-containing protein [Sphingomonas sp.]|uniref:PepSY-associated TM helix domain-containing protein n=1 Tax=Sphingomonas sp. TaxID=28214 RepID=UPI0031D1AE42
MQAEGGAKPVGIRILNALGVGAALIWLLTAVTGIMLAYHFELNDRIVSPIAPSKDFPGIERRIAAIEAAGGKAKANWIWTTAGMKDRFFLNYTATDGTLRNARIAGDGTVLLDMPDGERTALEWVREVHLSLAAGKTGEWILAISGILLLASLSIGAIGSLRRSGRWQALLEPDRSGRTGAWFRRIGLAGVIPAFVVVAAAVVIHFEHSIEGPIGAPPITTPAIPPAGDGAGFAAAARAAEAAVPGSRFVGGTMPTATDASFRLWVNQPGEYFRADGYGGSLVVVNGNDASVRGAWPLQKASAAYKFMALPYPVHTGEIAGPLGRVLVMLVGLWLATMVVLGLILRRRAARGAAGS